LDHQNNFVENRKNNEENFDILATNFIKLFNSTKLLF